MSGLGLLLGWLAVIGLVLLGLLTAGHLYGKRRDSGDSPGVSTVDGAVFALAGFLLAFAFSGAQSRLETRRAAVVNEANAIGTAYLRTSLADNANTLRPMLREYLDARMAGTDALPDMARADIEWKKSQEIGQKIWDASVAGTTGDHRQGDRMLLLEAMNTMLDAATSRGVAARTHLPTEIFVLLVAITALASFLAGRAMASHPGKLTLHRFALALVFASVLAVLIDLEHPRSGLIQLGASDQAMRQSIPSAP